MNFVKRIYSLLEFLGLNQIKLNTGAFIDFSMVEGTRLGKIESELACIENEMRFDKEQRTSFEDCIESQLSKMMDMIEKTGTNREDNEDSLRHSSSNGYSSSSTARISDGDLNRNISSHVQ